jgi:chromosome segregation ATPase
MGPTVRRALHQKVAEMQGRIAAYTAERDRHQQTLEEIEQLVKSADGAKAEVERLNALIRGIAGQVSQLESKLGINGKNGN